jgi:hypothetical protein
MLAYNGDLPNLSLLSILNYRLEPLVPDEKAVFWQERIGWVISSVNLIGQGKTGVWLNLGGCILHDQHMIGGVRQMTLPIRGGHQPIHGRPNLQKRRRLD